MVESSTSEGGMKKLLKTSGLSGCQSAGSSQDPSLCELWQGEWKEGKMTVDRKVGSYRAGQRAAFTKRAGWDVKGNLKGPWVWILEPPWQCSLGRLYKLRDEACLSSVDHQRRSGCNQQLHAPSVTAGGHSLACPNFPTLMDCIP